MVKYPVSLSEILNITLVGNKGWFVLTYAAHDIMGDNWVQDDFLDKNNLTKKGRFIQ